MSEESGEVVGRGQIVEALRSAYYTLGDYRIGIPASVMILMAGIAMHLNVLSSHFSPMFGQDFYLVTGVFGVLYNIYAFEKGWSR